MSEAAVAEDVTASEAIDTSDGVDTKATQDNEATKSAPESNEAETLLDKQPAEEKGKKEVVPDWPADWREKMAGEDRKTLKQLERLNSPEDLYKSYRAMLAKVSSGELKSTQKPEDEKELAAWREQNGIPEKPEGYIEKLALPDGVVLGEQDQPFIEAVAATAHELDIPADKISGLAAAWIKQRDAEAQAAYEANEQFKESQENELLAEMGQDYNPTKNLIKNMLSGAPEGVTEKIMAARAPDGTALLADANMFRWLGSLARELNPTGTVVPAGESKESAIKSRLEEIQSLRKTDEKKYWSDTIQQEEQRLLAAMERMKT